MRYTKNQLLAYIHESMSAINKQKGGCGDPVPPSLDTLYPTFGNIGQVQNVQPHENMFHITNNVEGTIMGVMPTGIVNTFTDIGLKFSPPLMAGGGCHCN